jgi:hypothetical protein
LLHEVLRTDKVPASDTAARPLGHRLGPVDVFEIGVRSRRSRR